LVNITSLAALGASSVGDRTHPTIIFLICSFNRRTRTLDALRCISAQEISTSASVAVVLFDDNSEDGTARAVKSEFPMVDVRHGDGDAYWSRGMSRAQDIALDVARPDYICWLNDDVTLDRQALEVLLMTSRAMHDRAAVVGALVDPRTKELTYSGYRRTGPRPTQLEHVAPEGYATPVDTFNGNLVLVPRSVYEGVGSIDPRYEHSFGDTDYGYRVGRAGFESVVAPRTVGQCSRNSFAGTWQDPSLSARSRVALLVSRKGLPPRSYLYFQMRHGGIRGPANFVATYIHAVRTIFGSRGDLFT
jgi:GT2 family glycosyltransferase